MDPNLIDRPSQARKSNYDFMDEEYSWSKFVQERPQMMSLRFCWRKIVLKWQDKLFQAYSEVSGLASKSYVGKTVPPRQESGESNFKELDTAFVRETLAKCQTVCEVKKI